MPSRWPKRFCCDEDLALIGNDGHGAARDLARLREAGPRPETQELIEAIRRQGVDGATVLDIGAGVGAVHLGLLGVGAERAVDIDASREYIAAAQAEALRRGLADRVEYCYGDAVEWASTLPRVDIVTMDSVICCYPYLPALFEAALSKGPRLVGLAYPRDVWWMRAYMRLYNAVQVLRRTPSRYFIYRHSDVVRLLAQAGYPEIHDGGSRRWRVALYRRADAA